MDGVRVNYCDMDILRQHGILLEPAKESGANVKKRGEREPRSMLGLRLTSNPPRVGRLCCVFAFIEHLQDNIPDTAIQLEGMTAFRVDRDAATSGKSRGGAVHLY